MNKQHINRGKLRKVYFFKVQLEINSPRLGYSVLYVQARCFDSLREGNERSILRQMVDQSDASKYTQCLTATGTVRLIRDGEMGGGGKGVWRWVKRDIIYISLHYHHQNDSCIEMGSDESHFNVSVGSDGQSHKTVSTNHNLFEEKGQPKQYRTEVLPLTSLTPYRQARPAHDQSDGLKAISHLQPLEDLTVYTKHSED